MAKILDFVAFKAKKETKAIEAFYDNNQYELDDQWSEYLDSNDWGSGEDRITITDDMFWEFIESCMLKQTA